MPTTNETIEQLTEHGLRPIKLTDDKQRFDDGGGLYLEVMPEAPESYRREYPNLRSGMYWHYAYTLADRVIAVALGDYPQMSLEEARREAAEIAEKNAGPRGPLDPLWQQLQVEEDSLSDLLDCFPTGLIADPDAKPDEQSYKDLARAGDLLRQANNLIEGITEREHAWSPDSGYQLPEDRQEQTGGAA